MQTTFTDRSVYFKSDTPAKDVKAADFISGLYKPDLHPTLVMLKQLYSSVIVTSVDVDLLCFSNDSVDIRLGLFRSAATQPDKAAAAHVVPHLALHMADKRTATSRHFKFVPATADAPVGSDVVAVPGLDWDLNKVAIGGGHPRVLVCVCDPYPATAARYYAQVQVQYSVTCSGAGPGY